VPKFEFQSNFDSVSLTRTTARYWTWQSQRQCRPSLQRCRHTCCVSRLQNTPNVARIDMNRQKAHLHDWQ